MASTGSALPSGGWRRVLAGGDLKAGSLTKVLVDGRRVLLARVEDGALTAASVVCPHRGEDLSGGHVYMGAVDCPWHHYLYDLRTGENRYPRCVFPDDKKAGLAPLLLYPVKEEGGWIWVALPETAR